MAVKLFIQSNEIGIMQIPVNPESLSNVLASNNGTTNIVNLGNVTVMRKPKLEEFSFECFFPHNEGIFTNRSYVVAPFLLASPKKYVEKIKGLMKRKTVIKLVVSGIGINKLVTIENFTMKYVAADSDPHYNITFREYVEYSARPAIIQEDGTIKVINTNKYKFDPKSINNIVTGTSVVLNGMLYKDNDMSVPKGTFSELAVVAGAIDIMGSENKVQIKDEKGQSIGWANEKALSLASNL